MNFHFPFKRFLHIRLISQRTEQHRLQQIILLELWSENDLQIGCLFFFSFELTVILIMIFDLFLKKLITGRLMKWKDYEYL